MRFVFLFLPLLLGKVFCCKDGSYCTQLMKERFATVPTRTKCGLWVFMLAPDLFPNELKKSSSNRIITSVQCPRSCGCPKVVVPLTPENKLAEIYKNSTDFKQLMTNLISEGINVTTDGALERYEIFTKNKAIVDEHNKNFTKKLTNYKMALNAYSVMKPDEIPPNNLEIEITPTSLTKEQIESATNIRKKRNANTISWKAHMRKILDQKTCGGCWAFAINAAVEGFLSISNITLDDSLSVQQLLDCDRRLSSEYKLNNKGCGGGYFQIAAEYMRTTAVAGYDDYPFVVSSHGMCRTKLFPVAPRIKKFESGFITSNSSKQFETLDKLMEARVSRGPVAIGMAVTDELYKYSEGIYEGPCGPTINHAVVLVGFTADYWIIRNSWGPKWGENGYIRIKRERTSDPCQLTRYWSQPIELGEWADPVVAPGEVYVSDEQQNSNNDVDCDGCEKCDECEDDDDDDEDDDDDYDNGPEDEVYKTTEPSSTPTKTTSTQLSSKPPRITSTERSSTFSRTSSTKPTSTFSRTTEKFKDVIEKTEKLLKKLKKYTGKKGDRRF